MVGKIDPFLGPWHFLLVEADIISLHSAGWHFRSCLYSSKKPLSRDMISVQLQPKQIAGVSQVKRRSPLGGENCKKSSLG